MWLIGHDPVTGEERGIQRLCADADLLLDATLNHPKSYGIAALLHPDLACEFESLRDRLRDQILTTWLDELNARRGDGGLLREAITRIEVVELEHRRSRALDPHAHRHLWLNVKVLGGAGKWSNVDSRVAMKLHTLINAGGDLVARADPQWVAALARHGFTLGDDGEVAELAAVVRRRSRRSAQIEANRAKLIAEWSAEHEGASPSVNGDLGKARRSIEPIAFERWEGRLRYAAKTESAPDGGERRARDVTDRVRARVFLRDKMTCTYCGGRCIPRNVLVAFSELSPDALPFHPNYRRGSIPPMYWALAPEADHMFAHARGGTGDVGNLTTLHAMCNARKSDSLVTELPAVDRPEHVLEWDGLREAYPSIVALGRDHGRRHSAADYHERWRRHFFQRPGEA